MDSQDSRDSIRETAFAMIASHDLCVLSTCLHDQPNASLMKYVSGADGTDLYMLTLQGSAKHASIAANPQVSLLIDTRADSRTASGPRAEPGSGEAPIRALTVYGTARIVTDGPEARLRIDAMAERHPDLSGLAGNPACVVIHVHAERLLLLDGVDRSSRLTLEQTVP